MGCIFCVMGKSASGKDTIYRELTNRKELPVRTIVPYTTRPVREGEIPGKNYFFCTEDQVQRLEAEGRIIELRAYHTVYGIWKYFTVDDGQIDLERYSYILIGTLETFVAIRKYFGPDRVLPVYIEVEDGERLLRAIARERQQAAPHYEEMCRRFLADSADFSEEKLREAGVEQRFINDRMEDTIRQITDFIRLHC